MYRMNLFHVLHDNSYWCLFCFFVINNMMTIMIIFVVVGNVDAGDCVVVGFIALGVT